MSDTATTTSETTGAEATELKFNVKNTSPTNLPLIEAIAEYKDKVEKLKAENLALRTQQITDGADPRLQAFWERAGRAADEADFCAEYDRLAQELNGPRRTYEFDVTFDATVTVPVTKTVTTQDDDDAYDLAMESIDTSDIRQALADGDIGDYRLEFDRAYRA